MRQDLVKLYLLLKLRISTNLAVLPSWQLIAKLMVDTKADFSGCNTCSWAGLNVRDGSPARNGPPSSEDSTRPVPGAGEAPVEHFVEHLDLARAPDSVFFPASKSSASYHNLVQSLASLFFACAALLHPVILSKGPSAQVVMALDVMQMELPPVNKKEKRREVHGQIAISKLPCGGPHVRTGEVKLRGGYCVAGRGGPVGAELVGGAGADEEVGEVGGGGDEVLRAEELRAAHPLRLPVVVVDEHVGVAPTARPGHDGGREDGRHPARRRRRVPLGPVHQDDVPGHVVELVGEVVDGEAAVGEEQVLHRPALPAALPTRGGQEVWHLPNLGGVSHVVGFQPRVAPLHAGDVVLVLVQEDGTPAVVERTPQRRLVPDPEHEQVARRPPPQHARDRPEVLLPHLSRGVGGRGVVDEGIEHRSRQRRWLPVRGRPSGRNSSGGGGSRGEVTWISRGGGAEKGEERGEGDEGEETDEPNAMMVGDRDGDGCVDPIATLLVVG
ncbi:hypothetical protein MUK42_33477 [Musa troglodytarum]|uniref:Uncharacterized protein n=1 Tax=Musa troglodytarum TaxID=320322 RepID=A0A9E7HRR1_9LILI|nr:hypothetical protein MUK42_33477 [Musa troglodytarum]